MCGSTVFVYLRLFLYVCVLLFVNLVIVAKAVLSVLEMYVDVELCELPTFFVCVFCDLGWRKRCCDGCVLGLEIVELPVYDWLAATRRQ